MSSLKRNITRERFNGDHALHSAKARCESRTAASTSAEVAKGVAADGCPVEGFETSPHRSTLASWRAPLMK